MDFLSSSAIFILLTHSPSMHPVLRLPQRNLLAGAGSLWGAVSLRQLFHMMNPLTGEWLNTSSEEYLHYY